MWSLPLVFHVKTILWKDNLCSFLVSLKKKRAVMLFDLEVISIILASQRMIGHPQKTLKIQQVIPQDLLKHRFLSQARWLS